MAWLDNPNVRVLARALLVGLTSAALQIRDSDGSKIYWTAVLTGAVLAFAEVLTPLNPFVGPGKKDKPV